MKTKLFSILFILISASLAAFSQGSFNIDLIGQKNEHRFGGIGPDTSFHYSSVWGYTHPNGREYAIIGYWNGTAIYDITNAPNVVQCDTFPGPTSFYNYREFTVVGNYLYAVSEGTNNNAGLQIVNLIYLPDSIHHVTNWTFSGYSRAHTIKSLGNYLYINGANYNSGGIVVVDVTNPTSPVKRGNGPAVYSHDCFVKNDTVYAANILLNGRMSIINATDKDNLTFVSQFNYINGVCHLVWMTNDRKWLVTSDEGGIAHARIWNCENLNNITFVYEYIPYQVPTMIHNAYFKDSLLFMAHYKAGVVALNCNNLPAAPTLKGYYDTYPGVSNTDYFRGAWNVFAYYNSGKFVVSDMQTGLYVFKFSDASGITPIGGEVPKDFKLHQNYPN
ncbi:MAG: choice-of-anchor B family protein, partial [Ignavibacteria bacterium]